MKQQSIAQLNSPDTTFILNERIIQRVFIITDSLSHQDGKLSRRSFLLERSRNLRTVL